MNQHSNTLDPYPWKVHVLYWLASVVFWVLFQFAFIGEVTEPITNKLCYLPSQMIVTYAFLYLLIPYLTKRRFLFFAVGLLLTTYVATTLARFLKIYVYETVIGHNSEKESILEILTQLNPLLVQYMIWVFMVPVLTIFMLLILNHFREKEKLEKLKKEKNRAELRFLKAQVHPHFLFNTLNNLYTLSIQQSPKTTEIARKLYDILNYMFNKCNRPRVNIREEIALISNYIDLEKIRYGKRLLLQFNHQVDNDQFDIAPLMFLSLVENAFKHGSSGDMGTPEIRIDLKLEGGHLEFQVFNTKPKEKGTDKAGYRKGIGLKNVQRQLELVYPGQYVFLKEDKPENHLVKISIKPKTVE